MTDAEQKITELSIETSKQLKFIYEIISGSNKSIAGLKTPVKGSLLQAVNHLYDEIAAMRKVDNSDDNGLLPWSSSQIEKAIREAIYDIGGVVEASHVTTGITPIVTEQDDKRVYMVDTNPILGNVNRTGVRVDFVNTSNADLRLGTSTAMSADEDNTRTTFKPYQPISAISTGVDQWVVVNGSSGLPAKSATLAVSTSATLTLLVATRDGSDIQVTLPDSSVAVLASGVFQTITYASSAGNVVISATDDIIEISSTQNSFDFDISQLPSRLEVFYMVGAGVFRGDISDLPFSTRYFFMDCINTITVNKPFYFDVFRKFRIRNGSRTSAEMLTLLQSFARLPSGGWLSERNIDILDNSPAIADPSDSKTAIDEILANGALSVNYNAV